MGNYTIFGTKVEPKFTNDIKNILTVSSKKELFFDVFECSFNGGNIVVEKIDEYEDKPLVRFEIKREGEIYNCEALLIIDKENNLFLNENNLEFSKNVKAPIVEKTVIKEVEKIIPKDTIYEEKLKDVSKKIISESEEKAKLINEAKLKEYELKQQQIKEQSEQYLNTKFKEYIKENIHDLVTDSNLAYDKLIENLNNLDNDDIKEILGERVKIINEQLNAQLKNEITSLKKYVEMSAGGGSDAQQYSRGGVMDGDLTVTGKVTAGTIAGGTELTGGTIEGDLTVTGSISADTITATTLLSTTQVDFVRETNGFEVTGPIIANGGITTPDGNFEVGSATNLSLSSGVGGNLNISATSGPNGGGDITISGEGTSISGTLGTLNFAGDSTARLTFGSSHANAININSTGSWGSDVFNINANTGLISNYGSAEFSSDVTISDNLIIAEKIIHKDDPNTFLRFGANPDTFTITTSGTERFHIGPAGNVGIGTNPSNKLHVKSPGTIGQNPSNFDNATIRVENNTANLYIDGNEIIGDNNLYLQSTLDGGFVSLAADNSSGTRVNIANASATGFAIGKGTGAATRPLDVTGDVIFRGLSGEVTESEAQPSLILFKPNADANIRQTRLTIGTNDSEAAFEIQTFNNNNVFVSNDYRIEKNANGADKHEFRIGNSPKLEITSDGVGIGTTTPIANLQVGDASAAQTFLMLGPNSNTTSSQILFGDNVEGADPFEYGMGIRYDSSNNFLHIDDNYNNAGSANNAIMSIDRDEQRVGINKTDPQEALHVDGNILGTGNIASSTISGTLQTNNNRSVVIGVSAAPSETAPNTEADPVVYRENIAIGYEALNSTSTGTNNVAIGSATLSASTTGKNNIAIGKKALETVNADRNIALGFNTLNVANVNNDNVVIGSTNLQNTSASGIEGNIIIGKGAGNSGTTGSFNDNIILGRAAFQGTTASSVTDSILLGQRAGKSLKGVGSNDIGIGKNVFFGANAGFNSGGNNIAIGENAQSNPIQATAKVNGATSNTNALAVDNNVGVILPGMTVTGTGIGAAATVTTVVDQNNLILNSTQTLSNNVDLTFTITDPISGSIKIGADGGTAGNFASNISTVDTASTLPGGGNRTVNKVTGSHSGLIGGFANIVSAETSFIGAGKNNVIAEQATGAAILGGFDNEVTGVGSAGMALGSNLRVQGSNQVVVGRFNVGNNNSKFIVGSGFSNANRVNALEIKNNHQLKLGKYGAANFTYDGNRNYNILAVGAANNVVEIPLHDDKLDSQFLNFDSHTVAAGGVTNIPLNVNKIVRIGWTGSTGTHQILLPQASNFSKRTIRFVTNGTLPSDAIVVIDPSGSETLNGLTGGISLVGTYKSLMCWSDGTEWYKISD